uniref:Uncharacterized protein n=1 Tax=Zea mays TaxID=4577 RepID=A0A804PLK1_MAIZE
MCSPAYRACHLLRCGRCPPLHDGAPHSAHDLDLLPHDHDLNRSASSATYARTTSTSPDSAHRRACGVEVERAAPRWQAPSSSTPSLRLENQRKPESPKLRARLYEGKHSTPTKKKCCNCRNSKCLKLFRVASHRRLPSPPRSRSRLQTYYLLMLDDMEAVVCLISLWSTTAIRTHNVQSIHMASIKLQKKLFVVAKRISNKILVELKFLHQIIFGRLQMFYEHNDNKMSYPAMAQLLSNILYYKRN